jgi:hypothetical protein
MAANNEGAVVVFSFALIRVYSRAKKTAVWKAPLLEKTSTPLQLLV